MIIYLCQALGFSVRFGGVQVVPTDNQPITTAMIQPPVSHDMTSTTPFHHSILQGSAKKVEQQALNAIMYRVWHVHRYHHRLELMGNDDGAVCDRALFQFGNHIQAYFPIVVISLEQCTERTIKLYELLSP